ncbi:hypothetical protein PSY31_22595, partial [Shigella flexneri]|nr:hypothetical protein [Shigella flexneri]
MANKSSEYDGVVVAAVNLQEKGCNDKGLDNCLNVVANSEIVHHVPPEQETIEAVPQEIGQN